MTPQKSFIYLAGYSGITPTHLAAFVGRNLFSTQEQSVAAAVIEAAELYLCQRCNRQFAVQSNESVPLDQVYVSTLNSGLSSYFFRSFPVKAVTKILLDGSVMYDTANPGNSQFKLNQDFFVKPDRLLFRSQLQSVIDPLNAVELNFTIEKFWGADVILAIQRWVSQIFLNREYGGNSLSRMALTGLSLDFNTQDTPDYIQSLVSLYRVANI